MLFFTNNIVSEHKKQSQQYGIELIEYGSELMNLPRREEPENSSN